MERRTLDLGDADTLTVADIMVSPVRTVTPEMTVAGLVRVLLADQITGAPVVDAGGRIVGVVSSSDVIRAMTGDDEITAGDTLLDRPRAGAEPVRVEDPQDTLLGYFEAPDPSEGGIPLEARWASVLSELTVADIMTAATFAVAPGATIRELAAFLTRGRIHRSLVVDEGALRGIVTTSDIVRLLAGDGKEDGEP